MVKYDVKGMSCAACVARVERSVKEVSGVSSCEVSLLTNSMTVDGTASESAVIQAVKDAGYEAALAADDSFENILTDSATSELFVRLVVSVAFVLILMYFAMGSMINLPVPGGIVNHLIQMILAVSVMLINRKYYVSGIKSAVHLAPNMDTLIAMGSGVAFVYSIVTMITGNGHVYYETAAMIPTFITIGKTLESKSKGKTTDALKSLIQMSPKKAIVVKGELETEVNVSEVIPGDIFVVYPGAAVPVDGEIISGNTSINESMLTGESVPVDKGTGDKIHAGTINNNGYITAKATKVGSETALAQIIRLVNEASSSKAPIAKIADRVAGVFVPVVLCIALLTTVIWLLAGAPLESALNYGIGVLVISCPCSLGLATPVAIMVGNGVGAKSNILFKNAESLEIIGNIDVIALDKTGTITRGEPSVTDVIPVQANENELIELACSLESKSEHPIAKAVVSYAEKRGIKPCEVDKFRALSGSGVEGIINGVNCVAGSYSYVCNIVTELSEYESAVTMLSDEGKTPVVIANGNYVAGILGIADRIKDDSADAVKEISDLGISVVMLTGDNEKTARAIGEGVGITNILSSIKPEGKDRVIKELQKTGKVAMVGDGINDAPALTRADIGIAIGAGTDVAVDAADVVLMKSSLMDVAGAVKLSRATLRIIRQNLFWAFFYNAIGIPVAAGAFVNLAGLRLSPMIGALCMSFSSVCVVLNALRLNLVDIHKSEANGTTKDDSVISNLINEINIKNLEDKTMTKTIVIEGMMCKHCEARVKEALEALEAVSEAVVSHEAGTAVVSLAADVDDATLKATVEAERYKVIDVK